MNDQTTIEPASGVDRRSALKKAAAAGAVVWAAPLIVSSRASAQTCTLKCAPNITTTDISVAGMKGACDGTTVPGQTTRTFEITNISVTGSGTCGCGGDATVDFTDQTIVFVDTGANQGTRTENIGSVTVTFTCLDRQGEEVVSTCTATIEATFSGSCAGVGRTTFSVSALDCTTGCA